MEMASIQRSILLAIFGCFLFFLSGLVVSIELPDITPESKLTDIVEYHLKDGIQELISTPDRELFYEQYYESYDALSGINVVELLDLLGTGNPDNKTCQMCNSVIGLGKTLLQSREIVVGLLGGLCKDTDSFSRRACLGVLERMADPVIWLFKNTKLQKEEICSLLTGHECLKFLGFESDKNIFWELSLPAKKEFKPLTPPANSKNKKILHLTDIHLDLWYEAGSNASCNEPLCCRPSSEDTKGIGHITGHWSEVKGSCDTPVHFVADSLKHIARAHPDLDAIFWTGDNVPHDVWNTTQKVNLLHIHTVTKIVAEAFPNIPVFPVLGNHEAHPINLYIPQSVAEQTNGTFSMKWLYETLTNDYWSKWIDTPEAKKTFLKAGYYSKMLQPNWKVIVLNTNIPQKENFWIMAEPMDPDGHLDWLIKELDHAESVGAYVTLLGHIPPKHGIFDAWMHNYIRVMDRYAHLITSGFFGHTHDDEIVLLYNRDKKPITINYISGSLTTFSYLNPEYTIFEMDSRGFPLDSSVYFTDIDEANLHFHRNQTTGHPVWKLEYHPKKSYNLADLSPGSWHNFLLEARDDLDLAYLYAEHYHRHSAEYLKERPMNSTDLEHLLRGIAVHSPFMNSTHKDDN